ncbi:chaperone modulator CbpM [Hymenobacter weizhouensis]|uniref:chaperone modulator CbpM n=1 Tax=Hymenobacter sp. YIM 151500-1 TaxID=2987689 RepID=UPI0022275C63|nr:chaperone modulator CbpM [Hymenobacter sp. YIM 151500-1]UYZ62419.1 chaperone modulator CbpM [Hymenobacter sp. YIM 151500-1]
MFTITIHECAVRYGLTETDVREFVELGLLQASPDAPDSLLEEPDQLARLARLHYDLGLSKDSLEVVVAMRRHMLHLQRELARQQARVRQLEQFLRGSAPLLDFD